MVTGPTGAGKTTTLYAALNHLNKPGVKICTVEDPVEYTLPGLNQTQVHPEIGLDFATMLRSLLRQDPNVLMIGEIRDRETAERSRRPGKAPVEPFRQDRATPSRAALVGRLVLSTRAM